MEDTLPSFSALENDDSFSILCSSLSLAKSKKMEEFTEVGFLLGKLGEVQTKYEKTCCSLAGDLDDMEIKHSDEIAAKTREYNETMMKLQETIFVINNDVKTKEAEICNVKNANKSLQIFMKSLRNQIDMFMDQMQQDEPVDIVTVESDDEQEVSDQEQEQQQPDEVEEKADEENVVEVQIVIEDEVLNENDLESNVHEQTAENGEGKENVRPQSTPISKAEAPVTVVLQPTISTATTATTASTSAPNLSGNSLVVAIPKRVITKKAALAVKNDGQSGDKPAAPKKRHVCKFCKETFSKKTLMNNHYIVDHGKKPRKKNAEAPRKLVRIASQKRKLVEASIDESGDDYDDDVEISDQNYIIVQNPMHQAMKRQKKNNTKYIYVKKA